MEYFINKEKTKITFEGQMKVINITVDNETGCYIPDRWEAYFRIDGTNVLKQIKDVMALCPDTCCLNPKHSEQKQQLQVALFNAKRDAEYLERKLNTKFPAIKKKEDNALKEKIDVAPSLYSRSEDSRKKLSDGDVDMIRQSSKGPTELARIFNVSIPTIVKIRNGERRK